MVDLTPPKIIQLYDGAISGIDESFQTSITTLSVSWIMEDTESGISEYQLSVYARVQGSTAKFYPTHSPFITLHPQEVGESGTELSRYSLYCEGCTSQQVSTVYTSNGIIPDTGTKTPQENAVSSCRYYLL